MPLRTRRDPLSRKRMVFSWPTATWRSSLRAVRASFEWLAHPARARRGGVAFWSWRVRGGCS